MSDPVSTDSEPLHPQPPTTLPEKPSRRGMSETLTRLLTAAVLIPSVLWVIVQGGLIYLAVVTAFVLLGQREFYHLIEEKGARPLWSLGLAAGAALQLIAYVGNAYHATLLMTASLLFLMVAQLRKRSITESLASMRSIRSSTRKQAAPAPSEIASGAPSASGARRSRASA